MDFFRKLLDPTEGRPESILPVSLLLLDINMPIVDGLECAKSIMELYKEKNLQDNGNGKTVLRPFLIFMTQTPFSIMKNFIQQDEQSDIYLEKPIQFQDLASLLKIFNVVDAKKAVEV